MGKIDLSYLEDITAGDNEVILEMLELIRSETPLHFTNLDEYKKQEDWKKFGAEAHKLKPMMLYIGMPDLHELAESLEKQGKSESNIDEIPALLSELKEGFQEIIPELEEAIERLKS